jgi:hypothetical protein
VVEHLLGLRASPPALLLVSGIGDSDTLTLSADYREYFTRLGRAIGAEERGAPLPSALAGHLYKTVRVSPEAARALGAESLDVVTERLVDPPFDVIVATNILPYFDDVELALALANIAAMLAPGGTFLHNESRPALQEIASALGLPIEQSRHAVVASVRGAPAPLADSVWMHRRSTGASR